MNSNQALPVLKIFFSRQENLHTDMSNVSYLGILNETCDNKDTVMTVMRELYQKLEIGQNFQYCMVVGDGKTYEYLHRLKLENEAELNLMQPYLGDWHLLKNSIRALMTIYGPAGLNNLAELLPSGCTLTSLKSASDFDKSFDFM